MLLLLLLLLFPENWDAGLKVLAGGPGIPPECILLQIICVAICEEGSESCVEWCPVGEFVVE